MIIGQPCLRGVAKAVPPDYPIDTLMDHFNNLVSTTGGNNPIAGPQIGLDLRIFSFGGIGDNGIVINPIIVLPQLPPTPLTFSSQGEGCLSLPSLTVNFGITRFSKFTLQYETLQYDSITNLLQRVSATQEFDADLDERLCALVQHEIDHLDGKLICDYAHSSLSLTEMLDLEQRVDTISQYARESIRFGTPPGYNYLLANRLICSPARVEPPMNN